MRPRTRAARFQITLCLASLLALITSVTAQPPNFPEPSRHRPPQQVLDQIARETASLDRLLIQLRSLPPLDPRHPEDDIADVAIFHKAATWIVRHDEFYRPDDAALTLKFLQLGHDRARLLLDSHQPWRSETGSILRAYISRVDGSTQPFAIIVPEAPLPDGHRYRLDVILHGRNANLHEVRFFQDHHGKPAEPDQPGLVLHVYGRGNNAYRWAGETDVFEAIEAVKRSYPVDDNRILLRGFSMGGAGAWHLGLHHPARWCAVEAGAGFTDTRQYLKRDDFPDVQARALHIYDAVDYALNAANLPVAGYGGELDKQLQASLNIKSALEQLGFPMTTKGLVTRADSINFLQVTGAQTAHKIDPASAEVLAEFRNRHAAAGRPFNPGPIRFTTYTLKFNQAPWLSVERLMEHYKPAIVEATPSPDGERLSIDRIDNVAVLGVDRRAGELLAINGQELPLRPAVGGYLPLVYYRKVEDRWELLDYDQSRQLQENSRVMKAPGLQGPIDDAFTGPFLCVQGTGTPQHPNVQAFATSRLEAFSRLWNRSMRADLPIKDDTDITADDISSAHLILFGDPGSNSWIRQLLPRLPLEWVDKVVQLAGTTVGSSDHVPLLIAPNPLNPRRYVVLNTGHTFSADAFAGTNALLYPRLGDHALLRLTSAEGDVVATGYFDEFWGRPLVPTAAPATGTDQP